MWTASASTARLVDLRAVAARIALVPRVAGIDHPAVGPRAPIAPHAIATIGTIASLAPACGQLYAYRHAMTKRGVIGVIFLLGCAAGGVAAQMVIPPIRAGTQPMRWEYLCVQAVRGTDQLSSALNKAGAAGWELVSTVASHLDHEFAGSLDADAFVFCFKRALP
jgi:hypothetical protein